MARRFTQKKKRVLGLDLDSNQNPNPKTQKNKTQTQTQTQKFLGFKNNLYLLRYFNEHIFSFFFKHKYFWVSGFLVFCWIFGYGPKPKNPKKPSSKPKPNKTQTKSSAFGKYWYILTKPSPWICVCSYPTSNNKTFLNA